MQRENAVNVLIVDDREENLVALEALLADLEVHPVRALCGNEALRLVLKHDFALVLLDVQMPEMDGFETAELMRANPKTRHLPIIFVTAGMKEMAFQFKGYENGAVDYLLKPLEPAVLRSKVRVFREIWLQRRDLEQREESLEALVEKRTVELVRTAERLLESEERYRHAFELAAVGIVHLALDGLLVRVNACMCESLGYAAGELQRQTLESVTHPDDVVIGAAENRALLEGRIPSYAVEKRLVCKDGNILWGHITVALARHESGEPAHYVVVIHDTTARKNLEQQLLQAQKMEAIGQLAGGIAHDFNNFLSVIMGYGNLAQMRIKEDLFLKPLLDQIVAAAEKASQVTRGLLTFSRKQQMQQQPLELNRLVENSARILRRIMGEDINFETSLHHDSLFVNADNAQLDQVLMNLASNARDAMPGGGVFSISTSIQVMEDTFVSQQGFGRPGTYAMISISDSGHGMDPTTLQNIFDPFFTTKEVGKGTGLGMAIVYGIVTQHDGFIKVYSEPGVGTTFRIYLPLIDGGRVQEAVAIYGAPSGGTETILLAEDDEAIRELEMHVLSDFGYTVLAAADGQEAVDLFRQHRDEIDLVLLDVIMPRKRGSEAYSEIRAMSPQTKVIFISGYTSDLIRERGLLEEGVTLLLKPVSPPALARKVREVLDVPCGS